MLQARTRSSSDEIVREIRIVARPETVFQFLIEPERIVLWMGSSATLEPHPGGIYRIDYDGSDIALGEFIEVMPNERVVFTWGWEAEGAAIGPGESTVEIRLTADGDGTLLQLRHWGLTPNEVDSHAEGWDYFLPRLEQALSGARVATS